MKKITYKRYARSHCPIDNNDKFYFEFNPNWKGLKVFQRTCTKCGTEVVLYQLNEASVIVEKEEIEKELQEDIN